MIFKDHFDYRGKAEELRAERYIINCERLHRILLPIRRALLNILKLL